METVNTVLESPIVGKLKELHQIEQNEARLRDEIEKERLETLKNLPASLGYTDSAEFVHTLARVHNVRLASQRAVRKSSGNKRKERVSISPENRREILQNLKDGKTKLWVMARWNISASTAQILKKEAGMTR